MTIQANPATPSRAPLQLGFIGGSSNSAVGYAHVTSCQMDNRWRLVSGCFSLDAEENLKSSQAYGISPERLYGTWQEMLATEGQHLDAVVVLTPTPSHFDVVAACLQRGIPVICEKALATSSEEADKLIKMRDASKGFLVVTYNYSGYPMVRELRHIIQKGTLGKIIHFQAEMPQEGFIRLDAQGQQPMPQAWRLVDGHVPTIHLDLAVHLHQMLYYLIKQTPVELVSDHNSYGWFADVVDHVSCLCRYSEGVQGQLWFSKAALGHRNGLRFRIYGSKGSAEWLQINPEELLLSHVDGRREIMDRATPVEVANQPRYNRFKAGHPAGFIESFANVYSDIADCLIQYQQTGRWQSQHVFGAELAKEGLQFLEAMVTSVHSHTWQDIPTHHPQRLT